MVTNKVAEASVRQIKMLTSTVTRYAPDCARKLRCRHQLINPVINRYFGILQSHIAKASCATPGSNALPVWASTTRDPALRCPCASIVFGIQDVAAIRKR